MSTTDKNLRSKGQTTGASVTSEPQGINIDVLLEKMEMKMEKKLETFKSAIIKKIDDENKENRSTRDFISHQYDDIHLKMETIIKLVSEVEAMRKELTAKDGIIKSLEVRLAEVEQRTREDTLEFAGIPEREGEQHSETIKRVAAVTGVDLKSEDILDIKKIPDRRPGVPPKLQVRFSNPQKRRQILLNRKQLNVSTTQGNVFQKIFISEILGAYFKDLLWRSKTKAKEMGYKFVWYKECKIMIKKNESDRIIYIKHSDDLKKIV